LASVNGIAHTILTVSSFDEARRFYAPLMEFFGMEKVFDGDDFVYWVGGRTALGIQPCDEAYNAERFVQRRVGLHHLCFRARERADIDRTAELLKKMGATIIRGPTEGAWAPGYYYVLFEDPDGIRLEINHVPGQGVLAEDTAFDPSDDFQAGKQP
jgi:catechol 2,3-dioxygenase-like lactoylglutathione lyase family enzyme